jgi:hypothetical protein
MKRCGSTLVELMAALAVTAVIALIAGMLLFDGLKAWRIQADREYATRSATIALDQFAKDLASQPGRHGLPDPVTTFSLGSSTKKIAFYIPAKDVRTASVCWYLSGDGPWTLRRIFVDADATESELSSYNSNAAESIATGILDESGTTSESSSIITCKGIISIEYTTPENADAPQLLIKIATPEGISRLADGESETSLPERCIYTYARPVR